MTSVSDWNKQTSGGVAKALAANDGHTRPASPPQNVADLLGNLYRVLLVFTAAEDREPHGDGDEQFWSALAEEVQNFRASYERPSGDPLSTPHSGDSKTVRG